MSIPSEVEVCVVHGCEAVGVLREIDVCPVIAFPMCEDHWRERVKVIDMEDLRHG